MGGNASRPLNVSRIVAECFETSVVGVERKGKKRPFRGALNFRIQSHFRYFAFLGDPMGAGSHSADGSRYHPTPNAETHNTRNRRRRVDDERETKEQFAIPTFPVSSRNCAILPLRSLPWGSVGFRAPFRGGAHQHPTPNAGALNTRNRRRCCDVERITKDRAKNP